MGPNGPFQACGVTGSCRAYQITTASGLCLTPLLIGLTVVSPSEPPQGVRTEQSSRTSLLAQLVGSIVQ
jgi:hypothetical protein